MYTPEPKRTTLTFYKYHPIDDPAGFRDRLFTAQEPHTVLDRIYVATEGIIAQLSLPANRLEGFRAHLDGIPFLRGVRLNLAVEQDDKSFRKLKIKVRAKIVADGIEDPDFDVAKAGPHLDARAFNDLIGDPDAILVDMRNHFESEIGYFQNAIRPDVDTFRDSLGVIENDLQEHKETKKLVMYCTGGIGCEKTGAYFLHKGYRSVYQLEGGVIEYLRQVKAGGLENKFLGKNFVFDAQMLFGSMHGIHRFAGGDPEGIAQGAQSGSEIFPEDAPAGRRCRVCGLIRNTSCPPGCVILSGAR